MLMLQNPSSLQAHFPESAESYPAVVQLNDRWRVIVCRDGIQCVLQRRHGPKRAAGARWEGRSYCRTSEAPIRCCRAYCGEIDLAALAALKVLPERIEHDQRQTEGRSRPSMAAHPCRIAAVVDAELGIPAADPIVNADGVAVFLVPRRPR